MQNPSILRNYYMLSIALDSWGRTTNDASEAYTLIEGRQKHTRKATEFKENKMPTDEFESGYFSWSEINTLLSTEIDLSV